MKIKFKDKSEIDNVSFQETGLGNNWNGTLSFSAIVTSEKLSEMLTDENVSEMAIETDTYTRELSGYKVSNITVSYTDSQNYVRVAFQKQI